MWQTLFIAKTNAQLIRSKLSKIIGRHQNSLRFASNILETAPANCGSKLLFLCTNFVSVYARSFSFVIINVSVFCFVSRVTTQRWWKVSLQYIIHKSKFCLICPVFNLLLYIYTEPGGGETQSFESTRPFRTEDVAPKKFVFLFSIVCSQKGDARAIQMRGSKS